MDYFIHLHYEGLQIVSSTFWLKLFSGFTINNANLHLASFQMFTSYTSMCTRNYYTECSWETLNKYALDSIYQ